MQSDVFARLFFGLPRNLYEGRKQDENKGEDIFRVKIIFLCAKGLKGVSLSSCDLKGKNVLVLLIMLIICFLLYYMVIMHN
jgi:hypothetical protein